MCPGTEAGAAPLPKHHPLHVTDTRALPRVSVLCCSFLLPSILFKALLVYILVVVAAKVF